MATQVVTNTRFSRYERGQSAVLFAFVMLAMVLFALFVIDYAVTTARSMETISAADLAAHAGAQDIRVLPNGKIVGSSQGSATAYAYFARQNLPMPVSSPLTAAPSTDGRDASSWHQPAPRDFSCHHVKWKSELWGT